MRVRAASKVNLLLRVMGRRPDGYHEIETILHGVGLADDVEVAVSDDGIAIEMTDATGSGARIPALEDNLVWRAAGLMRALGPDGAGIVVRVIKRIPFGAGLGGGSADAAAVIHALNELWHLDLERNALMEVAAEVGSDVPYCLRGGTCVATGRGERVTPLAAPEKLFLVLGISHSPLHTAEVYDLTDALGPAPEVGSAPMTRALEAGDVVDVAALLHNDLEPAAFELRPGLADKKERLLRAGALGAGLSGSGPTLFGLGSDGGHAAAVADLVRDDFDRVTVVASSPEGIERLD
jgi:4-diphosphocytidyl-2-C-methyl-D-erythritol kinase